jgi:nucleoside-diphosphate-sugar epimerase
VTADRAGRVVVTGAAGFIGTHLVRRVRAAGIPVVAVVRTPLTSPTADSGTTVIARDLARGMLTDVIQSGDLVVHLAARVHMMRKVSKDAESAYHEVNVEQTRMLCRAAAEAGARRVLFLSSAKVFGEGRDRPYTRSDPVAPADAYGRSKAAAEDAVREAARHGAFEWTIMRPPFVYGPGGKGNFPRLLALARLSTIAPLPLASIDNRRSILFVGNLVDAIARCGLDGRAAGQVLLPTDARDVSTPELLRAIATVRSSRAKLFRCPPALLRAAAGLIGRSAEMDRLTESLTLDSRHLEEELGWHPPFTLERALERTIGGERLPPGPLDR